MAVTLAMIYKKTPSCKGSFLQDGWGMIELMLFILSCKSLFYQILCLLDVRLA